MKKEKHLFAPNLRALLFCAFALLFFSPSAFAGADDWQPAVGIAILIPALVIAIAYIFISALHIENFKQLLHDEAANLVLTAVIALVIIAGMGTLQTLAGGIVCASSQSLGGGCTASAPEGGYDAAYFPYCSSIANYNSAKQPMCTPGDSPVYANPIAWASNVNDKQIQLVQTQIAAATKFNAQIGAASSVSGFCNMVGTGIGIAGCSAYGVMRGPISQLIMALGTGLMELTAMQILLDFASNYALAILLPLGIILRSLHFSRKAGGTIIALSLSLFLVFPVAILLSQSISDQFLFAKYQADYPPFVSLSASSSSYPSIRLPSNFDTGGPGDYECNPFEPVESNLVSKIRGLFRNSSGGVSEFVGTSSSASITYKLIFIAIVRTLLMGALVLTLTILAVRAIGKELGAEIDVWAIARLS